MFSIRSKLPSALSTGLPRKTDTLSSVWPCATQAQHDTRVSYQTLSERLRFDAPAICSWSCNSKPSPETAIVPIGL
eukprot:1369472-Prymnesium_polylepis.1